MLRLSTKIAKALEKRRFPDVVPVGKPPPFQGFAGK
jgi:hypothetical protein